MTARQQLRYRRMRIEIESPEQLGYDTIENNLAESSFTDMRLGDYGIDADVGQTLLPYGDHLGDERLRRLIVEGTGLSPADVDQLIRTPVAVDLPSWNDVPASINRGEPLAFAYPDHPVSQAIGRLAEELASSNGRCSRDPPSG